MTDSDQGSERVDVDRQTEQGPAGPEGPELTGDQRKAERRAGVALAVAIVAGIGLFVVYFSGGQTQVEGLVFAIALGALGVALGIWANHLLDAREVVEERHELTSGVAGRQAFGEALAEEVGPAIGRRSMLLRLLIGAGGALGGRCFCRLFVGPPRHTLRSPTAQGKRLVDEEGSCLAQRSPRTAS